ncbi:CIA30 family protein [Ekhidna sp.]|uniref:CIA30 family protein n=1 Tax=Ekhidna sp. TaxID=2608089 RepID=UPI003B50A98F
MIHLILVFIIPISSALMINFTSADNDWYIINDGVMGGLSKGNMVETDDGVLFYGEVSLKNNGGFSSFRSPWESYDLTNYSKVSIRYKSEGIKKAFVMETDKRFYIPNFKVSLPSSSEWVTKEFKLVDFKQYRLGNPTGESLQKDQKEDIIRIGFITDEKRAGDFRFEVDYIEFE